MEDKIICDAQDRVAGALRGAYHKALVCKNRDMIMGVEFAAEAIATHMKLEGDRRKAFFALIKAPKERTKAIDLQPREQLSWYGNKK